MTVETYFMINFHERMLPTWQGLNPQPPDHQSDVHPTDPPRPAAVVCALVSGTRDPGFNACLG